LVGVSTLKKILFESAKWIAGTITYIVFIIVFLNVIDTFLTPPLQSWIESKTS